ncbi:osmoprotectant transport system permease protein [Catalinimonas alkaloidigena]|uniref:Osmoprotectant transport system permease protein n=1 Tax=Catalinimonas alkaloidigena TaxID=1075417 RepID=A0A1G9HDH8_9BACT|nr:ABC transporter permease/substrate-binding protein [Catalinimonas alkaloidigena]SDL10912.1 osmoprotectant transport system permease protein [Catalinimonas alkaloidigena]
MQTLLHFFWEKRAEIAEQTLQHLWITLTSLGIALVVGLSLGIVLTRRPRLAGSVLGAVNVIQTIPSLALLGFLLPLVGIGVVPAIIALFLYALLPIVRNTYAGITEVAPDVREAARGLGMTDWQVLTRVELPLAVPVIFAGIRTAMVINIGIATLCALIAAGGLGEFIFRGIALNNVNLILAGAVPAALLALAFDGLLGLVQRHIRRLVKPVLFTAAGLFLVFVPYQALTSYGSDQLRAGFPSEFVERADGYTGLRQAYGLDLAVSELEIGLMYEAVRNGDVDVISGFSTDGRIEAYHLRVLEDDKQYFPPYYAAPLVRNATLRRYPELKDALAWLDDRISEAEMMRMNYQVDEAKQTPQQVAANFLQQKGLKLVPKRAGNAQVQIGSKNFTESFILAELLGLVIEARTGLTTETKLGFGGTKLVFDALTHGDIDLYPEYTGTGLLALLQADEATIDSVTFDRERVYRYVQREMQTRYDVQWLQPLGFNNTHAMMMRESQAEELGLRTISDLANFTQK